MTIKWVAELSHVREVSLHGMADAAFWSDRLKPESLSPAERDGRAQVLVVSADGRFRGIRFRELSFSVLVAGGGAFLVRAFNSRRLFAWMERAFFSTPYYHGDVRLSTAPVSIQLILRGEAVFHAVLGAHREPSRTGDEGWEGPVYLPTRAGRPGKLFHARIRGETRTYSFRPEVDSLTLRPKPAAEVLQALVDSHFAVTEWSVRDDALHAKSKTYARSVAQGE